MNKLKYMRKLIIVLAIGLVFAFSFWIASCTVESRIDWHNKQLDRYERLYPEKFTTDGLDSLIRERALELIGKINKAPNKEVLDSLENELKSLYKKVADLKNSSAPCDTILKEVEKIVVKETKGKTVWKEAPCVMDTISKDSAGVHVLAWGKSDQIYIKLSVDSTRIKYDCPPQVKHVNKLWFEYWQSKLAVAFLVLMFGFVVARWRR